MFGPHRICAVVAAPTAAQAERQFLEATTRHGSRVLELRLDYLRNSSERALLLRRLSRQRNRVTLIATCRTRQGGGRFGGGIAAEIAVLSEAVRAGCRWCDVELETAEQWQPQQLRRALAPARLLVSAHHFQQVPRDLRGLVRRLERRGADVIKIAAACRSLEDARRLLLLTRRRRNVIVVPMGQEALAARLLALREGSALAYAAVAQATAPGQISLDEMKQVYQLDRRFGTSLHRPSGSRPRGPSGPSRRTKVYGVIGNPIAHSLSPVMHNAAFAARRLNAVFLPFGVRDLRDFLASVKPLGIAGFAVTLPHKQAILGRLDDCEPLAEQIGAVNTVVVGGRGRLYGYNTDYVGVLRALQGRMPLAASRVLLLGAGGAARAAAFALAHAGAAVSVCARRPAQARALARAIGGAQIEHGKLRHDFFDAIVNCTPVGMHPGGGSPLEMQELNCRVVMDLIYRPRKTELLRRAERRGIEIVSGVEMFVAQGTAQWEIWTGKRAPETVMRRAVRAVLEREAPGSLGESGEERGRSRGKIEREERKPLPR